MQWVAIAYFKKGQLAQIIPSKPLEWLIWELIIKDNVIVMTLEESHSMVLME
jgi:hypothetical protein